MRGAWIEISQSDGFYIGGFLSLPMRGAWIEIKRITDASVHELVAPHAGSVD